MKIDFARNTSGYCVLDKGFTDLLKLLAILLIAFGHFFQYAILRGSESVFFKVFSSQSGYLGVAIFFFLSGYGLTKSWNKHPMTMREFFEKRVLKMVIPALLASTIWVVIGATIAPHLTFMPQFQSYEITWLEVIKIIFYVDNGPYYDGTMWFMKVLICLYLTFYLIQAIKQKYSRIVGGGKMLIITLLCFAVLSACGVAYFMKPWMAVSVPLFFIGMASAEYKMTNLRTWLIVFLAALIVTCIFFRSPLLVHVFINYLCIFLLLLLSSKLEIVILNLPSIISGSSLDIYLVHNKVRVALFGFFQVPSLLLYIIITLVCAFCFRLLRTPKKIIVNARK